MNKDEIILKLKGLRVSLEDWLVNPLNNYFDPKETRDLFLRFTGIRNKLQSMYPRLFKDLPSRKIPRSSGSTDFEGRGYIERKHFELLLNDINYCLEILTSSNKRGEMPLTDEHIRKLTIPQLIRTLSLGAWGLFVGLLIASFGAGYYIKNLEFPVNQQELLLGQLTGEKLTLVIEIWKYQKSKNLNKVIITRDGFIIDDGKNEKSDINLAEKVLGIRGTALQFEKLITSIPASFLKMIPETRLDSPYVVTIPEEAREILNKKL